MKRFTETTKWEKEWFMNLSTEYKLIWLYINDKCDNVGVWEPNFKLAEFCIGIRSVNWADVLEKFRSMIFVMESGKWWIHGMIEFQYGELKEDCRPHKSYLSLLKNHRLLEGYLKGINTLKEKDKEKDKDTDKEKDSAEEKNLPKFEGWFKYYDVNQDRAKCEVEWMRLTDEEKLTIRRVSEEYITKTPKQFRKNPYIYLKEKKFNNEIIDRRPADQQQAKIFAKSKISHTAGR